MVWRLLDSHDEQHRLRGFMSSHYKFSPLQKLTVAIGSVAGIGLLPRAAGTAATLATLPLCLLLRHSTLPYIYIGVLVGLFLVGIPVSQAMDRLYRSSDNRRIVIDEVCGFLVTMLWITPTPLALGVGFSLFRLFDILKPPPVGFIDRRLTGGLGVMLDDVVAGVMANLGTRLLLHLFSGMPL